MLPRLEKALIVMVPSIILISGGAPERAQAKCAEDGTIACMEADWWVCCRDSGSCEPEGIHWCNTKAGSDPFDIICTLPE